jgi:biopolymer transport protein ExbB
MKTTKEPKQKDTRAVSHKASTIFAMIAIPVELILAIIVFKYVMGDPSNFIDNNPANNPLTGNYLGTVYKGGFVVPILMTCFMVVITFALERWWTLKKARGIQSPFKFVKTIKEHITNVNLEAAKKQCDIQKGSIANIVRAGLDKFEEMDKVQGMTAEKKTLAVQKEIEDAEGMEMPMLERNLTILSTLASVGVLLGLFGTVLGMIRAFAALAHAGSPDATALATGISEALINTALGIGTSMLAIVFYNYFTTRIDRIIYTAAEAGQTIIRTFSITHPDKQN